MKLSGYVDPNATRLARITTKWRSFILHIREKIQMRRFLWRIYAWSKHCITIWKSLPTYTTRSLRVCAISALVFKKTNCRWVLLIHSCSKIFFSYAATATSQNLICVPWLTTVCFIDLGKICLRSRYPGLNRWNRLFKFIIMDIVFKHKKIAEITGRKYFTWFFFMYCSRQSRSLNWTDCKWLLW